MRLCSMELEISGTVVQIFLMESSRMNLIIFKLVKHDLDYTNFVCSRIVTLALTSSAPPSTVLLPLQREGQYFNSVW